MKQSGWMLKIRERFFKWLFLTRDKYRLFVSWLISLCRFFFTVALSLFILGLIFYIGFSSSAETRLQLTAAFRILLIILFLTKYIPEVFDLKLRKGYSLFFTFFVFLFSLCVFLSNSGFVNKERALWEVFNGFLPVLAATILIGATEISGLLRMLSSVRFPPALLFSLSFLFIILLGTGLLMMPNARNSPLSFLDSLFTSVSAVCVTGLTVVDTATTFTLTGKIILLCLIQIGGLGIMTFTGFFSYIFTSGSSFRDTIFLKELFSSESLSTLFRILTKIILFTLLTEMAGALIIYGSLNQAFSDKILFSLFHSVSAFCNAGFSSLSDNLSAVEIRSNPTVQITISLLVILGGIGFPVMISIYSFTKHQVLVVIKKLTRRMTPVMPGGKSVTTSMVIFMSAILIIGGAVLYYLFEKDGSLAGSNPLRKIFIAFFGSVSARTAGFNIVDISKWSYPTVFLMIFLMWVGASPGSTGGGIKTTTFVLAVRSAWNNIRGREYFKVGNREVNPNTISRVLSIVLLSILVIGAGFICLLLSEKGKDPAHLMFESFSAFGTVGLSLAGSSTFSDTGKIIDIILMFTGRVGPLTLFTGLMLSYRKRYARYPGIDIMIN